MKTLKGINLLCVIILLLSLFSCSNDGKTELVYEKVYVDKVYAEPVTFSVAETDVEGELSVAMSSKTEGAEIYYTTDKSVPTKESLKYSIPVTVTTNTTFTALAVKKDMENSPISYSVVSIREKKIIEVSKSDRDSTFPSNVTNLNIIAQDSRVLLTWNDADDEDIYGYEVSYSGTKAINRAIVSPLAQTSLIVPQGSGGCYVSGLTNGTEYTFTVKTVDTSENKSEGVIATATPVESDISKTMTIRLSPVETGTNSSLTINTTINSSNKLKKVVYKKIGSINAKILLADSEAVDITNFIITKGNFSIFATNEEQGNGIYTIAAIDEGGREETAQIAVTQFDFTPPKLISSLRALYSDNEESVTLHWTSPDDEDFDHVEIIYTYNDGNSDSDDSSVILVDGKESSIVLSVKQNSESSAKSYKFFVKAVDIVGNKGGAVIRTVAVDEGANLVYEFHDFVEYLPAGTDGTAGISGSYAFFGDWPQTIKAENVKINTEETMSMGGFVYYLGDDNNWYVKCLENGATSGYTYSDGTEVALVSANSTRYFKVEPIKWRILNPAASETEKKILLSECVLTANIPYYGSTHPNQRSLNEEIIRPNNYKFSNIRAYLNGINNQFVTDGGIQDSYTVNWTNIGFLQSAFLPSSQELIADTTVDNTARSTNPDGDNFELLWNNGANQYACDSTTDKIFFLSIQEITKIDYGFTSYDNLRDDNSRFRANTDYAKANYSADAGSNWWFLRSPSVTNLMSVHSIVYDASYGASDLEVGVDSCYVGIVPALCLN